MSDTLPVIVAATDDERLRRPEFPDRLEALLTAGCPGVWLRAGGMGGRELLALARDVRERCRAHGARLWIGERADVAVLAGADTLQLPGRGLSVAGARRVAGGGIAVGRSVHGVEEAVAAMREGADQLVAGTIFGSPSHPDRPASGPSLLAAIRSAIEDEGLGLPLFAIGGMTPDRAEEAIRAGADGVAAIRALWDAEDPAAAVRAFRRALRRRAR